MRGERAILSLIAAALVGQGTRSAWACEGGSPSPARRGTGSVTSAGFVPTGKPPISLERRAGDLVVRLEVWPQPGRQGTARFRSTVATLAGEPVGNARVSLKLGMPTLLVWRRTTAMANLGGGLYGGTSSLNPRDLWLGPLLLDRGDGTYVSRTDVSMVGTWEAAITVRRPVKPAVRLAFPLYLHAR